MQNQEIERKFLVKNQNFKSEAVRKERLCQGFLSSVPERTVRVRLMGYKGYITVKGLGSESGTTRFEWEKEISEAEARSLLELCETGIIDKTRYYVQFGNKTFEVDEFHGLNNGLLLAELELSSEDEEFQKPSWLGEEVTGQVAYYNAVLSKKPFTTW